MRPPDKEFAVKADVIERRQFRRATLEIPGQVYVPETATEADCSVTNMSPAGAEIACSLGGLLGKPIVVYMRVFGRIDAEAVWARDGRYGVKFNVSELKRARIAEQLARAEAGSPALARAAERTKSNRLSSYTREDGTIVPCVVLDFSTTGVQVKSAVRPPIGERIVIGGVTGEVVRYSETGIGVQFIVAEREESPPSEALDPWRNK